MSQRNCGRDDLCQQSKMAMKQSRRRIASHRRKAISINHSNNCNRFQPRSMKMDGMKFKVERIVDFGTIVSMVGVDISSGLPVVVHIDHRPFETIWNHWKEAGFPQPISFDADNLTLCLSIDGDDLPDSDERELTDVPAA